jgi:hypothetical protein
MNRSDGYFGLEVEFLVSARISAQNGSMCIKKEENLPFSVNKLLVIPHNLSKFQIVQPL